MSVNATIAFFLYPATHPELHVPVLVVFGVISALFFVLVLLGALCAQGITKTTLAFGLILCLACISRITVWAFAASRGVTDFPANLKVRVWMDLLSIGSLTLAVCLFLNQWLDVVFAELSRAAQDDDDTSIVWRVNMETMFKAANVILAVVAAATLISSLIVTTGITTTLDFTDPGILDSRWIAAWKVLLILLLAIDVALLLVLFGVSLLLMYLLLHEKPQRKYLIFSIKRFTIILSIVLAAALEVEIFVAVQFVRGPLSMHPLLFYAGTVAGQACVFSFLGLGVFFLEIHNKMRKPAPQAALHVP